MMKNWKGRMEKTHILMNELYPAALVTSLDYTLFVQIMSLKQYETKEIRFYTTFNIIESILPDRKSVV